MWYETKATEQIGIQYPVFSGPFGGGLSSVALTAAVSNAGGLGGYGAYTLTPQEIFEVNKQIRKATGKPYNINLWVSDFDSPAEAAIDQRYESAKKLFQPWFDEAGIAVPERPAPFASRFQNQLQAIMDIRPDVFSFVFGTLSADIMDQLKKRNIKTAGAATTLEEALALEATGVDMIVASGFEAGGHRPSFLASAELSTTGTFVLVQLIKEKVKVPVIAAGGIANGRGLAAAITLGADAAQIGTAFLATEESNAIPLHREMLFSKASWNTILTRAFTGRLGRGISSKLAVEMIGKEDQLLPFPLQSTFMAPLRKAAIEKQQTDRIMFWSGQIAPLLKHRSAAQLMQSIIEEASTLLK